MPRTLRHGVLSLALGTLLGCGSSPPEVADQGGARAEETTAPVPGEVVETTRARRGEIARVITTSGSIAAHRTSVIGPSVAGRIIHIFVDVGDEVALGAPLFQTDPGPYAIALQGAEAGLALASAQVDEAAEEANRTRKLATKEMVSAQEHRRARTRLAVAKAQREQAKARVAHATQELDRTLVLMPYDGSVVERSAHEGIMGTVRPNTRVVVVQESGVLEAVLDVPETSQIAVQPHDPVRLWIEGHPEPMEARVAAVNRRINERTRTYAVRVPVEDPQQTIKAGAFVRAEIEPAPRQGALLVDRAAVTRQDGAAFVFRVVDGTVERRPVRLGIVGAREAEILSGLSEADEVVVGAVVARLMDGAPIVAVDVAAAEIRPETPSDDGGADATP
jgi:RND family efflux transporter MFP subunit